MRSRILNFFNEKKMLILLGLILFVVYFYPYWMTGVMHNDELMLLSSRENGFLYALKGLVNNELGQGRLMRIMAPFNQMTGFLTANMIINRIIQSIILTVSIIMVFYLFYKVFENRSMAFFGGMCAFAFLTYTFESSVPQAYVCLTVIPVIEFVFACLCYIRYIDTGRGKYLAAMLGFYAVALLGYEYMITYIFVFPMIYCIRKGIKNNFKNLFKQLVIFGCVGVGYIICYVLAKRLFPGNYDGTAITFVSIQSSWEIIKQIIKSAVPGYFVVSGKYYYLFGRCAQYGMLDYIKRILTFESLPSLRTPILLLGLIAVWILLVRKKEEKTLTVQTYVMSMLFMVAYLVLPVMPNAVSKMYQGTVGEHGFVSLPVTFCVYVVVLAMLVLTIRMLMQYKYTKWLYPFVLVGILLLTMPVQFTNDVLMGESKQNFDRYLAIEDMTKTNLLKQYNGQVIGAKDLYKTKNTLAIRDYYWTTYAKEKAGLSIEFLNDYSGQTVNIFYPNDDYICISDEEMLYVLSANRLEGRYVVQEAKGRYKQRKFEDYVMDNGLYCYSFTR